MIKTCIKCGQKKEVLGPNRSYVEHLNLICSACLPIHKDDEYPYLKETERQTIKERILDDILIPSMKRYSDKMDVLFYAERKEAKNE